MKLPIRKNAHEKKTDESGRTDILVVEDDADIRDGIRILLSSEGYHVIEAEDGESALKNFRDGIDLIILDIMMPGVSGVTVCRKIRERSNVPVLFLTAKSREEDKLVGFMAGGDDYLTKPFSYGELLGRVKALLRRAAPQNEEEGILHVGGLTIDVGNYEAFRNGEKLSLTLKEFELLKLLVLSRGKVLTRDFLLDRIWGYEFYGETRTVDVHIRHIRQKLGDDAHYIETIRGVGYKFNDRQENRL